MPLDTYQNLQNSVLDWLARPGDPLVAPAIPDMILMFEEEARDRLRTRFVETTVQITPPPQTDTIPLPLDYAEMRSIWVDTSYGRKQFSYQTPRNLDFNIWGLAGYPIAFTIEGLNLRIKGDTGGDPTAVGGFVGTGTGPDDVLGTGTGPTDVLGTGGGSSVPLVINLDYMSGLTGLSSTVPTNWLLTNYPSLYLMGTLTMAAPYIGDDPRLQIWLGAREAGFERVRLADRRYKFPHGLVIQTDIRNP